MQVQSPDFVSTHSRPKAAALGYWQDCFSVACFNTQPPEGGCQKPLRPFHLTKLFQHTAARRRLLPTILPQWQGKSVSTHSRPKAAACNNCILRIKTKVSTHSRPKAAARLSFPATPSSIVSTHSRPKAAAPYIKR